MEHGSDNSGKALSRSIVRVARVMVFAAARRFPVFSALAVAALLLAGTSYSTPLPTRPHGKAPTNRVWLATTGSDSSCARNSPNRPCATFDRAFRIAHPGDTVLVAAGRYPETDAQSGATGIHGSKSQPVSFVCGGTGDVTFAAPIFAFYPGMSGVIIRGGCFRFHIPTFGFGGSAARTHDVLLDGVHMDSFECLGCANVTIRRSEIGPVVACGGPGYADAHSRCDASKPTEAYYATRSEGTADLQVEPFIHNGAAGRATRVTLIGDRIHGIQTRNSGEWHTGGLLIWNTDGLTLKGNTFDHNAIYDIEENAGSTDSNVTIENNVFGWPVNPFDGGSSDGQETPKDWREIDLGGAATLSGALIRYNSFAHGALFRPDGSFNNVQVIGNVLGSASVCAPPVSVDRNVFVGHSSCGTNVFRVSSWPYIDYKNNDFRLKPNSTAACFLANVRADKPGKRSCKH
jgi:hypothetical protein